MSTPLDQLLDDNLSVLRSTRELVERLDEVGYRQPAEPLGLSGIGPHVRHASDFYLRFLAGLRAPSGEVRRVDYDARDRDPRIETDPGHAAERLTRIMVDLRRLPEQVPDLADASLEVRSDGSPWTPSTVARELLSLLGHTVHHHALIAVLLRARGAEVPEGFGVAPSTLRHWAEQRQGADPAVSSCAR